MLKSRLSALAVMLICSQTQAATIGFDHFGNPGTAAAYQGSQLSVGGFTFTSNIDSSTAIFQWGQDSEANADPGGATYAHNYSQSYTTVTRTDGGSFDLISLDIGNVFNHLPYAQEFLFAADFSDGSSATEFFMSDTVSGLETVTLDWFDISAFYFTEVSGDYLQVDNIVLTERAPLAVSTVPLPGAGWLFGTALAGVLGLKRRERLKR